MCVWWEVRQTYRVVLLLPGVGMVGGGLGTVSMTTAVRVLCSHREEEDEEEGLDCVQSSRPNHGKTIGVFAFMLRRRRRQSAAL